MQKKIIALAVAGLASTAAFAQSNVTVYGIADAAYTSTQQTGRLGTNGITSGGLSGSRLGFKGVEDLGGGTKALFTLEYALALDDNTGVGTGASAARQQFVGLTGGSGTVVAGRLQTTGYDFGVAFDPLAGSAVTALGAVNQTGTAADEMLIGANARLARASNAIAYVSPSFSGVTLAANYSFVNEQNAASGVAQNGTGAALMSANYKSGPLTLGLVHAQLRNNTLNQGDNSISEVAYGASYDLGAAKLFGTYATQRDAGVESDNTKRQAYSLSAAVPVSAAGTVVISYGNRNEQADSVAANGRNGNTTNDTTAQTLAYTHALSKRTTAYAAYRTQKIENGIVDNGSAADRNQALAAIGIRHAF